jgi:hypothetical protein
VIKYDSNFKLIFEKYGIFVIRNQWGSFNKKFEIRYIKLFDYMAKLEIEGMERERMRSDDGMRFVMSYIYIFIAAGIVSHCIQL